MSYFSDRERGPKPRTEEVITPSVWGGIVGIVQALVSTDAFGAKFPEYCPDGYGPAGTDEDALALAVQAEMPGLSWPLVTSEYVQGGFLSRKEPFAPDTLLALDFIEFCYRAVALPIIQGGSYHSYFNHTHLSFDADKGKEAFRADINRIFSRNNLAYELDETGQVVRLAPAVLRERLSSDFFHTGDEALDGMLEDSRSKFLNTDPAIRRESLERLWDCWERLKSLENPSNKKLSVESLLSKAASDSAFRSVLDDEAKALTVIGNSFHIRHSEVTQAAVSESTHIDYLFHRLYCMIHLLLLKRGGAA